MVLSLAEEVRVAEEGRSGGSARELVRLQGVIVGLEEAVEEYKAEIQSRSTVRPARLLAPLVIPPPPLRPAPLLVSPAPPGSPECCKQPITPPTSPIRTGIARPQFPPPETDVPSSPLSQASTSLTQQTPPSTDESASLSPTISHVPTSPDSSTLNEIDFCIIPPSSIEPPLTP
ncbi:hypothetical protein H0H87_001256, partial [Tephrocybe sp. NHM501043]